MMRKTITVDDRRILIAEFEALKELTVSGSLYLSGTAITALPDNLSVGRWLDLNPYTVEFPAPGRMKIGCENHTINEWEGFSDSRIAQMDRATARKFWTKWKTVLIHYARVVDARRTAG